MTGFPPTCSLPSRQRQKEVLNPGLSDANACAYNKYIKILHISDKENQKHSSCRIKEEADSDQEASWGQSQPCRS